MPVFLSPLQLINQRLNNINDDFSAMANYYDQQIAAINQSLSEINFDFICVRYRPTLFGDRKTTEEQRE